MELDVFAPFKAHMRKANAQETDEDESDGEGPAEFQQALRDAQAEVGTLLAGTTMVATAYAYGGPQAALTTVCYVSNFSKPLRKIAGLQFMTDGNPMPEKRRQSVIMTSSGSKTSSAMSNAGIQRGLKVDDPQTAQLALPHTPELVD